MTVTDKLKEKVEELRQDLGEVKEQVKQLLPSKRSGAPLPVRTTAPDNPIVALQRETNRLFDDFLRGSLSPFSASFSPFGDLLNGGWPQIDIDESDHEIRIRADLAGMSRDDVDLSIADGMLTIRGEKKNDEETGDRHHFRRECFYGAFSRTIPVPGEVDLERIDAAMKNGVLRVTLPKLEGRRSRGKRIKIGSGAVNR